MNDVSQTVSCEVDQVPSVETDGLSHPDHIIGIWSQDIHIYILDAQHLSVVSIDWVVIHTCMCLHVLA